MEILLFLYIKKKGYWYNPLDFYKFTLFSSEYWYLSIRATRGPIIIGIIRYKIAIGVDTL